MCRIQLILLLLLTVASWKTLAQESETTWERVATKDSIELAKYFKKFQKAFDLENHQAIRDLSLTGIDCDLCITSDYDLSEPPEDDILPIDTFLLKNVKNILESKMWEALKERGYKLSLHKITNYRTSNLPQNYGGLLELYELWIQTFLPNEWAEGHEGQSHAFQFVKLENQFKFYGITSVP